MKRFIALALVAFLLCGACGSKRVQVTTNPSGGTEYVIDDRYKDLLESDLPAEAKERALKDLINEESSRGRHWAEWILVAIPAALAAWAAYEAQRAGNKVSDATKTP